VQAAAGQAMAVAAVTTGSPISRRSGVS
jgi:hypothetical protein